jgi:hypothetical protein
VHAAGTRLVRSGAHHPPFGRITVTAHDYPPAAQFRVAQHLDRGKELVEIDVQHPPRHPPLSLSPRPGARTAVESALVLDHLWRAAPDIRSSARFATRRLPRRLLNRWLVQDAVFAAGLPTFQARPLARAPRFAQRVLAGGCVGLVEELAWFDAQAERRALQLAQPKLSATEGYTDLLRRLDHAGPEAAVTAPIRAEHRHSCAA